MNELQLNTGPYKTTFIGIELVREETQREWENYGEIIKRVDEAKQWAIGDWLVRGKKFYGDKLYERAAGILGVENGTLRNLKSLSESFEMSLRNDNLSYNHHIAVSSLKTIIQNDKGKWCWGPDHDMDKAQEMLKEAEKEKMSVRDLRDCVDKYKRDQQRIFDLTNAPEKYQIIYADPPWEYSNTMPDYFTEQGDHYDLMSLDEICKMPIKKIAAENSVLFIWATSPILEDVFKVINSWGFKYKSSFIWDKIKHNMGHYNSVRHELLLIAICGSFQPDSNKLYDSVVSIERTEHSKKPEYFRNLINELYPNGRRIELFARTKVDGWENYGNELS